MSTLVPSMDTLLARFSALPPPIDTLPEPLSEAAPWPETVIVRSRLLPVSCVPPLVHGLQNFHCGNTMFHFKSPSTTSQDSSPLPTVPFSVIRYVSTFNFPTGSVSLPMLAVKFTRSAVAVPMATPLSFSAMVNDCVAKLLKECFTAPPLPTSFPSASNSESASIVTVMPSSGVASYNVNLPLWPMIFSCFSARAAPSTSNIAAAVSATRTIVPGESQRCPRGFPRGGAKQVTMCLSLLSKEA
mmetsp:Transcript_65583/g.189123  ORF Transcript_65583/g.189123 Transcript_65583/m.189123 type:complete len:243 (+) Transcript_65583:400-1128(+)